MDINYSLKMFGEFESESAVELRKIENAKAISKALKNLGKQAAALATKIHRECAVIEAKLIIDN